MVRVIVVKNRIDKGGLNFIEPYFIFTDEKRFGQIDIETFNKRPEYWWDEVHRALKEDKSNPYKVEYYTNGSRD